MSVLNFDTPYGNCRGCDAPLKGNERCMFGIPEICTRCDIFLSTIGDHHQDIYIDADDQMRYFDKPIYYAYRNISGVSIGPKDIFELRNQTNDFYCEFIQLYRKCKVYKISQDHAKMILNTHKPKKVKKSKSKIKIIVCTSVVLLCLCGIGWLLKK